MRSVILFLVFFVFSCQNRGKGKLDDIVELRTDGTQEVKVEQLTVEDVARLEADAGEQGETFQGILNNSLERTFLRKTDTNQTIVWKLEASQKNAKLYVYKETISSIKVDSSNYQKVREFKLVCEAHDSCVQSNKKVANYKAIVKLSPKFLSEDSTCDFKLIVIKK